MKHTVAEHKLANGAQGLVVNVPGTEIVNLVVRFNSGFQFAPAGLYEVPHVMEHLIGCGSRRYPEPNQFKIEVEKNGAYRNAYTAGEVNGYVIECARFELERILDLLEEYLTQPLFPQEAVPTEVSNVREELNRFLTQHPAVCSMALSEKAYPYEDLDYQTRIDQLPKLKRQNVVDYYTTTHTAANARFYVGGDFDDNGQAIVRRLERLFDRLARGERREPVRRPGIGQDRPIVTQRDISQIYYRVSMYAGECDRSRRNALILLRVLLTGGFQSRVYGEARRRGLAYHVEATSYSGPGSSSFGYGGYVTAANIEPLFELMAREFDEVRAGKITPAELVAAKDLLVGSSQRAHQTAGDMLGWYLGPYDREGEVRDYDQAHQELREVTAEQIVAATEHMTKPGAHGISLLGSVDDAAAAGYASKLELLW